MEPGVIATYKGAGVDVHAGDDASKIMFTASRLTWENRRGRVGEITEPAEFFGDVRFLNSLAEPDAVIGMNFDGVGTKIEVAERTHKHTSIAHDLFAMVCDDAAVKGGEPVAIGSILDCNRISIEVVKELAEGMVAAARSARVAVINGEVAELGERVRGYGEFCYNWGATVLWVGRRNRMLTGREIRPGDTVVAVRERGLRSNGISLVRRIFGARYGDDWHSVPFGSGTLGEAVLFPSLIYTPLIVLLTGGYSEEPKAAISGMAHVTGGGVPGKLARLLLRSGCGAVLDELFGPCDIMKECQAIGRVPDAEAYKTWNMGQGLLIVTRTPEQVVAVAEGCGFEAQPAGRITDTPTIRIRSKGVAARSSKGRLQFPVDR